MLDNTATKSLQCLNLFFANVMSTARLIVTCNIELEPPNEREVLLWHVLHEGFQGVQVGLVGGSPESVADDEGVAAEEDGACLGVDLLVDEEQAGKVGAASAFLFVFLTWRTDGYRGILD